MVGEHMQVRFCGLLLFCFFTSWPPFEPPVRGVTDMDRFGEMDRSRENLTDEADDPHMLTRVGEVARRKKVVEREEKLDVEDAKAEAE